MEMNKFHTIFFVPLVLFLLLIGCSAKEEGASNPDVREAENSAQSSTDQAPGFGNWSVDQQRSSIKFSGIQSKKLFEGEFENFQAEIYFDPEKLDTAKIEVVIMTASAKTGDKERDGAMPGADWFHVKQFPEAIFKSEAITKSEDGQYVMAGLLTIRGVSQPVSLPFSLEIKENQAIAKGELTFLRTDFGVGQGNWATDEWVGLEIGVMINIYAEPR